MSDFYGDNYKWFIGRVVDDRDDQNSNRVKVNIMGIHPLDAESTTTYEFASDVPIRTPASIYDLPAARPASLSSINPDNLPGLTEFDSKISKHFTLGQLTIGTVVSGNNCRRNIDKLNRDIIFNLTNLATNCLDPIFEEYGSFNINSGWRPPSNNDLNHQYGYAVDIVPHRGSHTDLALFIKNKLYGRYNFLIHEYSSTTSSTWCHVQLGSRGVLNQGTLEKPLIQTYVNNVYVSGIVQRSA